MKSADLYRSFYATCNNGHIWALSAHIVWASFCESMKELDGADSVLEEYSWAELEGYYWDNSNTFNEYVLVKRNSNSVPEYFEPCEFNENEL